MIDFLQGRVLHKENSHISLGIGQPEFGVVGYSIHSPERLLQNIQVGDFVSFYVYSHVREDLFELFGFLHPDEKKLFLLLISVNGIGPKGALSIMSHLDPPSLVSCILEKNKEALTSCPGVGKKTAERMVLELYDPVSKRIEKGEFQSLLKMFKTDSNNPAHNYSLEKNVLDDYAALFSEARLALMELGIREAEAGQLLQKLKASSDFHEEKNRTVASILKAALKQKQRSV